MATIVWNSGSGSWGTGTNWNGGVPTLDDSVTIDTAGATVTVGTGVAAQAYTLNTSQSVLSIAGGTLYTVDSADFSGNFIETSGTYMAGGFGATFYDTLTLKGGTIQALAGAKLNVYGGGTLAGTLTGTGALDLYGGTTYINTGFSCSLSSIVVNALVGFDINFTTTSNLTVLGNGSVDLFGHTLTVSGDLALSGVLGSGVVTDAGTMTIGTPQSTATLDNGLVLNVTKEVLQSGNLNQGTQDAGAKIAIAKAGEYLINGNWNINNPSSIGTITNAGQFDKTGGGKASVVSTSFSNTGTVDVRTGTLLLNGLVNSVAGTASGAGTLGIAGGQTTFGNKLVLSVAALDQQSGNLILNAALAYGGQWSMTGGVLDLNATAAKLTLTGQANFDGGVLSGYGGTLNLKGLTEMSNMLIGGPNTLSISGTLDQTGNITFGQSSSPTADILSGATWSIEGNSSIYGNYGLIENQGTFIDPNGSAVSRVYAEFASTGTVSVDNTMLQFDGTSTILAGKVSGTGTLDLAGTTTLASGVVLSVAELNIDGTYVALGGNTTYANTFVQAGNSSLDLQGYTLSLTGAVSLDGGALLDAGLVSSAGPTTLAYYTIDQYAGLTLTGLAEQVQTIYDYGTITVASGATYTLDDDYGIAGNGLLSVAGTFVADGTGTSSISAAVVTTGVLEINDQVLQLQDGGTLGGTVSGQGSLVLQNSTFTLQSGLSLATAALQFQNATVDLAANESYSAYFVDNGTVNLGTETLSLSGTTVLNNATIAGAGTLIAAGTTTIGFVGLQTGATLDVTGSAEQIAGSVTMTNASLVVATAGSYTLENGQAITGTGTLSVAGSLTAAGDNTDTINVGAIVDTGTIAANLGTLNLSGAISGSGKFTIGTAQLDFTANSTFTAGGAVPSVAFTNGGGDLLIGDMSSFAATVANFASGDIIEIAGMQANSITGTYGNAAHTQLLITDAAHDALTLNFSTAQTLSSLTFGAAADGLASITHI